MEDRVARLDAAVAVLTERVRTLELRLVLLEREPNAAPAREEARVPLLPGAAVEGAPVQQWLALAGRTLLVLGGAFLLRALTESHMLTAPVGVAIGLLYGAPWLLLAARAGARGAQLDAFCHAISTALIGYPLVWEATRRFGVLAPPESAALLGALTAAALVLSAATRLHGLAWVVTFGAFASAAGLALATGDWNSYTLLAIALGLGTLWLGYFREWGAMRWPAAAGANLMLAFATDQAALSGALRGALLLQLLAFGGYIGSFALRSLARPHPVAAFEVLQGAAVIVVALGGSLYLLHSSGWGFTIGLTALALGLAAYALAFTFAQRRRDTVTFFFWALFALVLCAIGTSVCAGAAPVSVVFAASGATLAIVSRRCGSLTLDLHASVCAMAAAFGSGLVAMASSALMLSPAGGWGSPGSPALIAVIALAAVVLITGSIGRTAAWLPVEGWGTAANMPRLILVGALLWTAMGVAVLLAASMLGDPGKADASVLATLRTAILVAATLALARVARYESGREAGWLMYPLLVITGMKLVFVDLPLGRPQTLFAALALYGIGLIAAPRLLRGVRPPQQAAAEKLAPASQLLHH